MPIPPAHSLVVVAPSFKPRSLPAPLGSCLPSFVTLFEQSVFTAQVLPLLAPTSSIIWIGSTLSDRCVLPPHNVPVLTFRCDCCSQGCSQQLQLLRVKARGPRRYARSATRSLRIGRAYMLRVSWFYRHKDAEKQNIWSTLDQRRYSRVHSADCVGGQADASGRGCACGRILFE